MYDMGEKPINPGNEPVGRRDFVGQLFGLQNRTQFIEFSARQLPLVLRKPEFDGGTNSDIVSQIPKNNPFEMFFRNPLVEGSRAVLQGLAGFAGGFRLGAGKDFLAPHRREFLKGSLLGTLTATIGAGSVPYGHFEASRQPDLYADPNAPINKVLLPEYKLGYPIPEDDKKYATHIDELNSALAQRIVNNIEPNADLLKTKANYFRIDNGKTGFSVEMAISVVGVEKKTGNTALVVSLYDQKTNSVATKEAVFSKIPDPIKNRAYQELHLQPNSTGTLYAISFADGDQYVPNYLDNLIVFNVDSATNGAAIAINNVYNEQNDEGRSLEFAVQLSKAYDVTKDGGIQFLMDLFAPQTAFAQAPNTSTPIPRAQTSQQPTSVPSEIPPSPNVPPSSTPPSPTVVLSPTPDTPIAVVTATAIATATPVATTENPLEQLEGVSFPQLLNNPEYNNLLLQGISPFISALSDAGLNNITQDQVIKNLRYSAQKDATGKPYIVATLDYDPSLKGFNLLKGSYDLFVVQIDSNGNPLWTTNNLTTAERLKGVKMQARVEGFDKQVASIVVTGLQTELGSDTVFRKDAPWDKIAADWDNVQKQLLSGNIPYADVVFDPSVVDKMQAEIDYGVNNNLDIAGDTLFYPTQLIDLKNYPIGTQKIILMYQAAAKALKFPTMQEIDVATEMAAYRIFRAQEFADLYQNIGGDQFLADLAIFVKQVRPDLKLRITEDLITDYQPGNANFSSHYNMFMTMLTQLKQSQAPIDKVKLENSFWIGAPPTQSSISTPLQAIQKMGYKIGAPDTIFAINPTNPMWTTAAGWKQTSGLDEPLCQQALDYYLVCSTYLANGARELGLHSITDNQGNYWLPSGDIISKNGSPKLSYYTILKAVSES